MRGRTPLTDCQVMKTINTTFQKIGKNSQIVKHCIHIWNQHAKCIKMNTNKPMFGPVVLEIACDIS